MKGYKALMPIVMIACMVLSVYMIYSTRVDVANEYNGYLKEARNHAELGVTVDAREFYQKALDIKDTLSIRLEVGEMYVKLDDQDTAVAEGELTVEKYPHEAKAYEFLFDRYLEMENYNKCYSLYDTFVKRNVESKKVNEIIEEIKYKYFFDDSFDDVGSFCGGFCPVYYNESWGYITEKGQKTSSVKFAEAGLYINNVAPVVTQKGNVYFVDTNGNKKIAVPDSEKLERLTALAGGCFAAYDGKQWTYYDKEFKKLGSGYLNVSLLQSERVAVEKDDGWYVLDSSFEEVNKKKYEDVLQDVKGVVCRNDRMFVKEDGNYYLVDKSLDKISKTKYKDAKMFNDDTYAAVKTEKGWTFIDADGKIVFKDKYFDGAESFSCGFAAVKKDGKWGYIDIEGNVAIECLFDGAKEFNASGCAFVKMDNKWDLLKLYSYNYKK